MAVTVSFSAYFTVSATFDSCLKITQHLCKCLNRCLASQCTGPHIAIVKKKKSRLSSFLIFQTASAAVPPLSLFQVGENIAEGVKNCLGHRFCLQFRQYFNYLFSHHIAIVWPSVTAFASVSMSASVWTCALIYTSPSVFFKKYCLRFLKPVRQCVERFLGLHIFRFDVSVSMSFNIYTIAKQVLQCLALSLEAMCMPRVSRVLFLKIRRTYALSLSLVL